jgi:hypothetical protein
LKALSWSVLPQRLLGLVGPGDLDASGGARFADQLEVVRGRAGLPVFPDVGEGVGEGGRAGLLVLREHRWLEPRGVIPVVGLASRDLAFNGAAHDRDEARLR